MPEVQVDDIDRRLLEELVKDARLSVRALSRIIGMSASAVSERLERLQSRGIIRSYRAEIDHAALGLGLEAVVGVQLSQHRRVAEAMVTLSALPEVVQVDMVTGRWDLLLRLRLRDQHHLKHVLTEAVWELPYLRQSESMIVLETRADLT